MWKQPPLNRSWRAPGAYPTGATRQTEAKCNTLAFAFASDLISRHCNESPPFIWCFLRG